MTPKPTTPTPGSRNLPLRVIGIDTSLRSTGIGIVEAIGSRISPLHYSTIRNPATRPLSASLVHLQDQLEELLTTHTPHAVAVEGIFYAKNVRTMMILSHARGVLIAQCARHTLPIYEYEPRRVKMAVAGFGGAGKSQIQKMVKTLLNLSEEPQHDAADALAIAITHLHNRTTIQSLTTTKPI